MQVSGVDWVTWERNPPYASHMCGNRESVRSVQPAPSFLICCKHMADYLMRNHLQTLIAEEILNSQPLRTDNINDPTSSFYLSPWNFLTKKSKITLPPRGELSRPDLYSWKRWRWVQQILVSLEEKSLATTSKKKEMDKH